MADNPPMGVWFLRYVEAAGPEGVRKDLVLRSHRNDGDAANGIASAYYLKLKEKTRTVAGYTYPSNPKLIFEQDLIVP